MGKPTTCHIKTWEGGPSGNTWVAGGIPGLVTLASARNMGELSAKLKEDGAVWSKGPRGWGWDIGVPALDKLACSSDRLAVRLEPLVRYLSENTPHEPKVLDANFVEELRVQRRADLLEHGRVELRMSSEFMNQNSDPERAVDATFGKWVSDAIDGRVTIERDEARGSSNSHGAYCVTTTNGNAVRIQRPDVIDLTTVSKYSRLGFPGVAVRLNNAAEPHITADAVVGIMSQSVGRTVAARFIRASQNHYYDGERWSLRAADLEGR